MNHLSKKMSTHALDAFASRLGEPATQAAPRPAAPADRTAAHKPVHSADAVDASDAVRRAVTKAQKGKENEANRAKVRTVQYTGVSSSTLRGNDGITTQTVGNQVMPADSMYSGVQWAEELQSRDYRADTAQLPRDVRFLSVADAESLRYLPNTVMKGIALR